MPPVAELSGRGLNPEPGTIADSGHPFDQLAKLARAEVLRLASAWTAQYRGVPPDWPGLGEDETKLAATRFFLAGHQATLFHPGVWLKNFVLNRLARRFNGVAINLVIDDEPESLPGVRTPFMLADGAASWRETAYDDPGEVVPGELRRLQNQEVFGSFASRLKTTVRHWVKDPLVEAVWPHAIGMAARFDSLPHVLAAARHRFEEGLGLRTLEVPLSRICATEPFARFAAEILIRGPEFARIYNDVLGEFRKAQGIRSPNHPVPPLAVDVNGTELPFWLYSRNDPVRRRVQVRLDRETVRVSADGSPQEWRVGVERLPDLLQELPALGICFRPRALLTTMFARLLLADQFVHGIGGALYDRLTDRIAQLFFGVQLPGFLTATGTWRWIPWNPGRAESELLLGRRHLRGLEQQPERHVELEAVESRTLVEAKQALLARMGEPTGRRERQLEMEQLNVELRRMVEPLARRLASDLESAEAHFGRNQVIASREVPFIAHRLDLPERLAAVADRLVGPAS